MSLEFDDLLLQTIEDQDLTRKEKQLLKQLLDEQQPDPARLTQYRQQAFATARAALKEMGAQKVLDWLEEVVKVLQNHQQAAAVPAPVADACFSPGDNCPQRIAQLIASTKRKLEICVFTITDDRISRPILEAHRRGVAVRIITDNEKLNEPGSDIENLGQVGIPIRVDRTQYHMHHEFALFDDAQVLTGSYNWTRGAAQNNLENFVVSNDAGLLRQFAQVFEKLWKDLEPFR